MSRKPVPAQSGDRSRAEVTFDRPELLPRLFGEYDTNLVALENRLGVYITARGNRVQLEGSAEAVALARDVLGGLHARLLQGQDIDPGMVDAVIGLAAEPTLDGIVRADRSAPPPIMIRTRKKTIVPRTIAQTHYMRELVANDMIFALGPAGTGKTYIAVAQAVSQLITGSVQRLILSRPAVEAGEKLGFLPGDMKEKVDP
ncbi:PhoH family protein, partial [Sphingomonas sp.]|uniref:PhoH family protein n=1 Tax=Sphingomonas sp. TaxID=28214 RepID=UPI002B803B62